MAEILKAVLLWPMHAVQDIQGGAYIAPAAAVAGSYYWYGMPNLTENLSAAGMQYLAAGAIYVGVTMLMMKSNQPASKPAGNSGAANVY
jgi:hypothetical protein